MTAPVFGIILLAALLHALWNSLVKVSGDRAGLLGLISLGHVVLGAVMVGFVPFPALASWPYIAASTVIHFGYYALLNRSYRLGDLSLIYPIARGIAPAIVTLGAAVTADEHLPPVALVGIAVVSVGVMALSGGPLRGGGKALVAAIGTGATIGAYSLVDGLGVRLSGAPLGYIAWLFIFEIFVVLFVFSRPHRRILGQGRRFLVTGIGGGLISATAYGLVIFAKTLAPLGLVSTLRESSVLFAALIGVVFLHERPWKRRLGAALVVLAGVLLIAASQA